MKKKLTIIDVLIILVLIIAVIVGCVYAIPKIINRAQSTTATFTVLIAAQEPGVADAMHVGDSVSLSYTDKDGGRLVDIQTQPAETMTFDSIAGEYKTETIEGKEDIFVTVEADVNASDTYIKTGETFIRVGSQMPIRGKGYVASGFVISLDEN